MEKGIDSEKILFVLEERDKWKKRQDNLEKQLVSLPPQDKRNKLFDLEKIKEQVAYYDALAMEIKKVIKPSKVSTLLNSIV
jgi:hypothetical protein